MRLLNIENIFVSIIFKMQKFGSGGTNKSKDLLYILDCQKYFLPTIL